VTAYHNKWPSDWQQHWLYHDVTTLVAGGAAPAGYEGAASSSRFMHEESGLSRRGRVCYDAFPVCSQV
jgi:hypothetical protein